MSTRYYTKHTASTSVTVAEVEKRLRKGVFVKRGDIVAALGLTRNDAEAIIGIVIKPVPLPALLKRTSKHTGKPVELRDRFLRSDVIAYARTLERRTG